MKKEDFQLQAERNNITRWNMHNCSICDFACGYVFIDGLVYYDSGCDCTNQGQNLKLRSWQNVADFYKSQSKESVIAKMDEFWGFK